MRGVLKKVKIMTKAQKIQSEDVNFSNRQFLRTIWNFLRPHKNKFFAATVTRFFSDLIWLYPAYALAEVINTLTKYKSGESLTRMWWIMGIWALIALFHTVLEYRAKLVGYRLAERLALDAYQVTSSHLFNIDLAWHTKINTGNKLKKIQKGAQSLDEVIRIWITNIIEVTVNTFGMIAILLTFDLLIGFIMIGFINVYFWISYSYIKKASSAAHVVNVAEEDFSGLLFEVFNNIRSVKVMSMSGVLIHRIKREIRVLFEKISIRVFWFQSGNAVKNTMGYTFRLGIVVLIIYGVLNGRYEIGFLVLFYTYFNKIWQAMSELADVSQRIVIAKYGIARMVEVLQEPVNIDDEKGKVKFHDDWKKIEVKNLSFDYGEEAVLKNLSFTISRGQRIGIMGLSGAGKSTLFKILLKEYDDYTGDVLIDGVSFKTISKKDYFNHVAVVLQETEVFNFKLRDNITISNFKENKNTELFNRATSTAHIDELIEKLPQKDQTLIGEKGIKLSGGEKQRLGLARAIFKDPQVLFLDEATSHLDIESEEKIQDSLHKFFKTITAVVIAHRLTTIKEMDRILVMEDGQIIEEGSFDELYKKNGRFTELWDKQKL